MKETAYNATAIEDGTFLSINEANLNETSTEGGVTLDKPMANGTNNDPATFLDKLSDRADKLSDKALLEYTKHRSVADQLTQKEKIGVAIGTVVALTLLITCGCCCRKHRRVTKVSKKGGKPGAQMTKYKEPLVQGKVEERPWTNSFFKWEAKKGRIEYANGGVYEGELSDGQPHGWGVLQSPDATHEGEWKDGKKHGKGVYKYSDGDEYEGEWKEGKKHGKGNYKWSSQA
jgi:hypothetical protein